MWRHRRRVLAVAALGLGLIALAHPGAGADVWANVGPGTGLGGAQERYPLGNYALDQHFDAVSAGLSGIDVSGIPPMIAYFLASVLWQLTAFLANALISLFAFAFDLDLVGGSAATGGAGALGPVSEAIHSIYARVFGAPWLVVAVAIAGIWAMWRALVMRRYAETAGALGVSLIYLTVALFFVAAPARTIGTASAWTNEMSGAFLSVTRSGDPTEARGARQAGADQLFALLVARPWSVLQFGGTEHCVKTGTGSGDTDPESVAVRPLPAQAARELGRGSEVQAAGKTCINDARKYPPHFLAFEPGSEERDDEYEALDSGDASKLPDADPAKEDGSYALGPADMPATDAMEEGGQYQRLLIAVVVFGAELGAFCLLGSLAVGVILAQVLLLLLLAFAPVALVAAVIPGRGHELFKAWLAKLAGYLLRKAAYSLVLAVLLAVLAALSAATSQLGWLMSFGLQALFLWAVFLQRHALTEGLIGLAAGPGAPGREGTLRVLALYSGARTVGRPLGAAARSLRGRRRGGAGESGSGQEDSPAPEEPAADGAPASGAQALPGRASGDAPAPSTRGVVGERAAAEDDEKGAGGQARRRPSPEGQEGGKGGATAHARRGKRDAGPAGEPEPAPGGERSSEPGARSTEEPAPRRSRGGPSSARASGRAAPHAEERESKPPRPRPSSSQEASSSEWKDAPPPPDTEGKGERE